MSIIETERPTSEEAPELAIVDAMTNNVDELSSGDHPSFYERVLAEGGVSFPFDQDAEATKQMARVTEVLNALGSDHLGVSVVIGTTNFLVRAKDPERDNTLII